MCCWYNRYLYNPINEFFLAQIKLLLKKKKVSHCYRRSLCYSHSQTDIQALYSVYLFFWCYVQLSTAFLHPWLNSFSLVVVYSKLSASEVLHHKGYHAGNFFSLTLGFSLCHFCIFANLLLQAHVTTGFMVCGKFYVS